MNLSVPELWDELSAPEKLSDYHNSLPSFFPSYDFFLLNQFSFTFLCGDLADIADTGAW